MLNTASRSTDWMPCVPRSITRDRPPVWRSRWKRSDEPVQVLEGLQRQLADGALLHGGEHRVAQLGEAGGGDAQQAVGHDQRRPGSTSSAVGPFGDSASTARL